MRFHALSVALDLIQCLRQLIEGVQSRDRALADQLRRAASSVPLNLAEGRRRAGKDRLHLWRVAAGSAAEVRTCLQVATAWGYLAAEDVAAPLDLVDRLLAMTWRLTH